MARESGETIRDMVMGFNQMQMQLGLLPQQSGSMPLGVTLNQGPPPPPVLPPYAISMQAHDRGMQQMQQTVQASQMTRYQPPAPGQGLSWAGTMNNLSSQQMNPYIANAIGGGGFSLPPPPISPQFGMYRQMGGRMGGPPTSPMMAPGIHNPYVSFPGASFTTPVGRDYANQQAMQARGSAGIFGAAQAGAEIGGSLLGGALGTMLGGPIGGFAGSWLGGHLGSMAGGMMMDPVIQDHTRGRQIQAMTSPFMVSGASMNPFTGQGMERSAGIETARGLRHITRDHDFVRQTGFNQQDMTKLTSLAGDQGLLDTARNPEDITRRMKEIAKSVKALIQITHDPDVKAAMADLGNLRNLGFQGIGNQMGAVANRAMFSRMAGVSQGEMHSQFGMPGAMAAQNLGLAGASGYALGMGGAGVANVGISSGSFSDLQLARAGGRAGVSQSLTQASLGALNQDIWMAAALKRNSSGALTVDVDKFKKMQGMDVNDVAAAAASNLDGKAITALSTRRQEFKDQLIQQMSPMQQQMAAFKQIAAIQKHMGPDFSFGSAAVMMGLNEEQARSMELLKNNPEFWRGQQQQLDVERRNIQDREAARDAQFRTPGLLTRAGRGIADLGFAVSDVASHPAEAAMSGWEEMQEDRSAQGRGERVFRLGAGAIHNEGQRRRARAASGTGVMGLLRVGVGREEGTSMGRNIDNIITSNLGITALNKANYEGSLELQARGISSDASGSVLGLLRNKDNDIVSSVRESARALERADSLGSAGINDLSKSVSAATGVDAASLAESAAQHLSGYRSMGNASGITDATRKNAYMAALKDRGIVGADAEKILAKGGAKLDTLLMSAAGRAGNKDLNESLAVTRAVQRGAGAQGSTDLKEIHRNADAMFRATTGYETSMFSTDAVTGKGLAKFKSIIADEDPEVIALAALKGKTGPEADKQRDEIRKSLGDSWIEKDKRASVLLSENPDMAGHFQQMGQQGDVMKRARVASGILSGDKALSNQTAELAKVAQDIPELKDLKNASARDVLNAVGGLGKDSASRAAFQKQFKGVIEQFEGASESDKNKIAEKFGASLVDQASGADTSLVGGETTAAMKHLKEDQTELNDLRGSMGPQDRAFVDAVDIFAGAAKDLRDAAHEMKLKSGNPFSGLFGG